MGAPGLTSPIRTEAFENLQLNAGVFIPNFTLTGIYDPAALKSAVAARIEAGTTLGMTSGGGTFTIARDARMPDVDGRRYPHKGAQFVDSLDASITGTLVEITAANWENVIGTTSPLNTNTATKAVYNIETMLDDGSYLTNLCWIGDLADGRFVVLEFVNALNTADMSFTFADKNEGKLPFEFHAHQGAVLDYDTAPCMVHFFDDVTNMKYWAFSTGNNTDTTEDFSCRIDVTVTKSDDTLNFAANLRQIRNLGTGYRLYWQMQNGTWNDISTAALSFSSAIVTTASTQYRVRIIGDDGAIVMLTFTLPYTVQPAAA